MRRISEFILCMLLVAATACTSSTTPTNFSTGTGGYDDNYEASARGSRGQQQATPEEARTDENPPVVIMLMSMETGDVYPGEDYYVYAVVDNPDNRDLEYVWSVANGDVAEVPEAERGRLATLVETEYDYAQATAAPGVEPAIDEAAPIEGEEPPPAEGTGEQPPEGAGLPGQPPAGGGGGGAGTVPPPGGDTGEQPAEQPVELPASMERPEDIWTNEEISKFSDIKYRVDTGAEPPPEPHEIDMMREYFDYYDQYNEWLLQGGSARAPTDALRAGTELRIVAGEDDEEDSSNVEALAEQLAESIAESAGEAGEEATIAQNVAEEASDTDVSWVGRETAGLSGGRALGLRSEYEVWRDESGEPRRRNLGGYGDPAEVEPLEVDDSYDAHTLVTEEPYILWTPRLPGDVRIYVKATYKDEELTEPMEMAVTVRLRDPAVELSDEFPDVVREDESVYVALDGSNIPAFYKGLFTLTFDANKLSFREAELGEFFDDVPSASMFYAQPDKLDGRVLLAIDSNTELGQLGGDGALMYVKFKAKQDIADQAETQLAMVLDTSARYILNREGENVLPLPTTYPIYRTTTTMPPLLPEYTRERIPGTKAGEERPDQQQQQEAAPADGQQPPTGGGLPLAPEYERGGGSPYIPSGGDAGSGPVAGDGGGTPTQGTGTPPEDTGTPPEDTGTPTNGSTPTNGGEDSEGGVPQDASPFGAATSEVEGESEDETAAEEAAEGDKESTAEATGEDGEEAAAAEADEETEEPEEPSGEEPASEPAGEGEGSSSG